MLIARKDWVPLLHGEERPRVLQLVAARARRIARLLLDVGVSPTRIREVDTSPILFGPVAVGMAYLHAVLAEPIFEEAALCAFGAALNAVATITSPSLHQGFLSLAWSSRQLAASGIVPLDPAGLQAIENEVGAQLSSLHRKLGVDLADGMAGVGLYALCHLSHEAATNWTEMIVARLKPSTVVTPQGATVALTPMSGPDRPQAHPPTFVLAMAHGSAGIATFLSTARAATNSANASALLDEFIRFIVAHRLPSGSFPSTVGFGARLDRSGSWCWGDSGFAVSLLNAAMATGREDLAQMACDSLSGLGPTYCGDIARLDTCLCHGTAGVNARPQSLSSAHRHYFV